MNFVEYVFLFVIFEDYDAAGVGANDDVVLLSAHEAELSERANGAEDFDGEDGLDPAIVVGTEEIKDLASGDDDFLALAAGEVAVDGTDDAGGTLESETVEIHGVEWLGFNLGFWFQLNIHSNRVAGEEDGIDSLRYHISVNRQSGTKNPIWGLATFPPSLPFYTLLLNIKLNI